MEVDIPFVVNMTNTSWDCVLFGFGVLNNGVVSPRALPQLVRHSKEFIRNLISLIMSNLRGEPEILRCCLQMTGDSIPSYATFRQMIKCTFASKNGFSYVVEAVIPNGRCFVTAAMAATGRLRN